MKLICGKENVKAFNAELKQAVPEFHALAKSLHQSGLIDGLRGATLEIGEQAMQEPHQTEIEPRRVKFCGQCRHFSPDKVGDGTGIGYCTDEAIRYPALVWPRTEACERFRENTND